MKLEELKENAELKNEIIRETEEKAQVSHDLLGAEIEVLKAHGIEFDEDELRAAAVEKMQLSEENLENVAGGKSDRWCWGSYACHYIYKHDKEHIRSGSENAEACFRNWVCAFISW